MRVLKLTGDKERWDWHRRLFTPSPVSSGCKVSAVMNTLHTVPSPGRSLSPWQGSLDRCPERATSGGWHRKKEGPRGVADSSLSPTEVAQVHCMCSCGKTWTWGLEPWVPTQLGYEVTLGHHTGQSLHFSLCRKKRPDISGPLELLSHLLASTGL